jgi:hypothetical protein
MDTSVAGELRILYGMAARACFAAGVYGMGKLHFSVIHA